jgi:hypothetical protein
MDSCQTRRRRTTNATQTCEIDPTQPGELYLRQILNGFITGNETDQPPSSMNWPWLEKFVLKQGIFAILVRQLSPSVLPAATFRRWQHAGIEVAMHNSRALAATRQIMNLLDKAAIPVVGMRGIVLAHLIYPDAMLRPMADVDLLIPAAARDAFQQLVEKNTFGPVKHLRSQFVFGLQQTKFEVHWSLLTPRRYRRAADFDAWTAHRRYIETPLGQLACLCPEHELLGLICHWAVHHELAGLVPAIDIARFVHCQNLDWDYLRMWCTTYNLTRLVTFTLAYIDALFDMRLAENMTSEAHLLPRQADLVFAAYMAKTWERDNAMAALRRKKNLFFIAESASKKFKQALRMLDPYDLYRQHLKSLRQRSLHTVK